MELLMIQITSLDRTDDLVETAFLTGILSLLDALYETPMEHVVESLNLSEDMANALLRREGQLGMLLLLAEKLEKANFDAVQEILTSLSISLDQLLAAQLDAFSWRSSIVEDQRNAM
jgi:c-di-GMP-related signal transduction protein